jgi:hypothetical protein
MKNIILVVVVMCLFVSCQKNANSIAPIDPTTLPQIDFSNGNYYTPTELKKYQTEVNCADTAYWENKQLNLKGFFFAPSIDSVRNTFVLYDERDFRVGTSTGITFNNAADKTAILNLLLANKDKNCTLRVTCKVAGDFYWQDRCRRSMIFDLLKVTNITF